MALVHEVQGEVDGESITRVTFPPRTGKSAEKTDPTPDWCPAQARDRPSKPLTEPPRPSRSLDNYLRVGLFKFHPSEQKVHQLCAS